MEENDFRVLLDETNQMIQISDANTFEMLYANKPAIAFSGHSEASYRGRKCYEYMMGLKEQCPSCPLHKITCDDLGRIMEVDNGTHVFTVKTMRLEWEGHDAFIEYATDITTIRRAQESYRYEMEKLLTSIPNAQGIFRLNLTRNSCFGTGGHCEKVEMLRHSQTADTLVRSIAVNIVCEKKRQEFISVFGVESLMMAYRSGKTEVHYEAEFHITDERIEWSRMTARIMINPATGDWECVLYGMDISHEKSLQTKMNMFEEALKRESYTGLYTKSAFENLCREYLEESRDEAFAIVFLDMDHLKVLNDTCGHMVGDQAIADIARKLQVHFSNIDIVSRFGGDEFAVLVKDIDLEILEDKLRWLLKKTRATYEEVDVTTSIGAVYCEAGSEDYYKLMDLADQALYQAKDNGRDCFHITCHPAAAVTSLYG